jgi:hypothetical protein
MNVPPRNNYHPDMYGPVIDVQGEGFSTDQLLRYLGPRPRS